MLTHVRARLRSLCQTGRGREPAHRQVRARTGQHVGLTCDDVRPAALGYGGVEGARGPQRRQMPPHAGGVRAGAQAVRDPRQAGQVTRLREQLRVEPQLLELRTPQDIRLRLGASEAIAILVRMNNRP